MSQIKLKHSGGNSVIIAAPDSNPASDRTLKLPSNADGTIVTNNSPATGSIVQVVSASKTDTSSINSTTFADISGLSVSITPASSSNKIFLLASLLIGSAGTGSTLKVNFVRGSTAIGQPAGSVPHKATLDMYVNATALFAMPMSFLDSPSTTSTTTYKLQWAVDSVNNVIYANRYHGADNYHGISTLTAMEVAA
tara:strand:- start:29 stop:613 length:585 start_codon:yes stop_codon:yes gene_type:complete